MTDKDDLLLDIVEKIHDNVQDLKVDVQDIKIEQVRQNVIVEEHHRRSTAAEQSLEVIRKESNERLIVLERESQFFKNAIIILSFLGGLIIGVIKIYSLLTHL